MTHFHEITAGGESDNIAPDPDRSRRHLWRPRRSAGSAHRPDARRSIPPSRTRISIAATWTLPLVVLAPRSARPLLRAPADLHAPTISGEHWAQISPDLTREDPGVPPNLDPPTAALHDEGSAHAGASSTRSARRRSREGDLWAGTDDGLVWRNARRGRALGATSRRRPSRHGRRSGIIEPSHHDASTAYIAVDRHRLDDFASVHLRHARRRPHMDAVVSGIPTTHAVNVVREDPVRRGPAVRRHGARVYVEPG